MTLTELVREQAFALVPELPAENQEMLKAVCSAAVVSLENKLRSNVTVEDCHNQFVMAASMYAVAAMSEITEFGQLEQFTAGDLTVHKTNGEMAANCLRAQADMLMSPYVKTGVAFMGV
ncbi:MAG: hypothetical protein IJZ15_03480 [Oscillospiraceae bacterium]|nr:hypothetical protein [Oscillospiraceae bacterium]